MESSLEAICASVVKHFVEVADAEQQNGVGIAALDFAVLPHQR